MERHVTLLAPRILRWLLDFWKIFWAVAVALSLTAVGGRSWSRIIHPDISAKIFIAPLSAYLFVPWNSIMPVYSGFLTRKSLN